MQKLLSGLFLLIICNQAYSQNKQNELQQYFSTLEKNNQFNGYVLVVENGKVLYQYKHGFADFVTKTPITAKTRFPIASISKTITATAVLQLFEDKKLAIDDAVKKHLPPFPYPEITIRHLLSHTSGLPPYNAYFDSLRKVFPDNSFNNSDFLLSVSSNPKPLIYQPGEKGNYDNVNFIVLALLVEKIAAMPFGEYIRKFILAPAGMTQTISIPAGIQYGGPIHKPFAYPYVFPHLYSDSMIKAMDVPYINQYWSGYNFTGFGDYVSTVEDLEKYDKAYYNGSLLNQQTINLAFEPVKLNSGKNNPSNFGLGWQINADTSLGKLVYHGGNATGLSCILMRNITKHQTIIVFDNIHNNNSHEIAFNTLKIINGIKIPMPKKSVAVEYVKTLLKLGAEPARTKLYQLKSDTAHYRLSEDEMNLIGYDLMGGSNNPNPYRFPEQHKYREAEEVFKMNVELFPNSWNVYDSYGEILLKVGKKEEAIAMYKKSVELNPGNTGGKKILEELSR